MSDSAPDAGMAPVEYTATCKTQARNGRPCAEGIVWRRDGRDWRHADTARVWDHEAAPVVRSIRSVAP